MCVMQTKTNKNKLLTNSHHISTSSSFWIHFQWLCMHISRQNNITSKINNLLPSISYLFLNLICISSLFTTYTQYTKLLQPLVSIFTLNVLELLAFGKKNFNRNVIKHFIRLENFKGFLFFYFWMFSSSFSFLQLFSSNNSRNICTQFGRKAQNNSVHQIYIWLKYWCVSSMFVFKIIFRLFHAFALW